MTAGVSVAALAIVFIALRIAERDEYRRQTTRRKRAFHHEYVVPLKRFALASRSGPTLEVPDFMLDRRCRRDSHPRTDRAGSTREFDLR